MTDCLESFGIRSIISQYEGNGVDDLPNGIFICPLRGGELRYLHKLFTPIRDTQGSVRSLVPFNLPKDYISFFDCCNGVTLFDNTFSVFGWRNDMNRGLHLRDQGPISLQDEIENRCLLLGTAELRSIPVASVSGRNKLFEVDIEDTGNVIIRSPDGGFRGFLSFSGVLQEIATALHRISDQNGLLDESGLQVDYAMEALVASRLR